MHLLDEALQQYQELEKSFFQALRGPYVHYIHLVLLTVS
jgi:hypothetical protein